MWVKEQTLGAFLDELKISGILHDGQDNDCGHNGSDHQQVARLALCSLLVLCSNNQLFGSGMRCHRNRGDIGFDGIYSWSIYETNLSIKQGDLER